MKNSLLPLKKSAPIPGIPLHSTFCNDEPSAAKLIKINASCSHNKLSALLQLMALYNQLYDVWFMWLDMYFKQAVNNCDIYDSYVGRHLGPI